MLKENERLYHSFLSIFDILITLIAFVFAYSVKVLVYAKSVIYIEQYLILGLIIIPVWYILFKIINFQGSQKIKAYSTVIIEYTLIVLIGVSILFVFIFWLNLESISRVVILIFAFTDLVLLSIIRIISFSIKKRKIISGKDIKNVVIFADESSFFFINKLILSKQLGYKIFAIVTSSSEIKKEFEKNFKILEEDININTFIEQNSIDDIIYCKDKIIKDEIKELIYSCTEVGVNFQIQSDFFSLIASKSHLNYLGGTPVLSISSTSTDYFSLSVKKIIDYLFAIGVMFFTFPVFAVIATLIKLESKGPTFFKQKRVGLRGRMFTMYKFRTMVQDAEEQKEKLEDLNEVDGPVFKIKNDPRITKMGAFLRKSSLDELPQFINVLKGDMSVVGPRPPIRSEVDQYERWQLRRLSMKPGITCIWQVSGRNNISFDEWMKMDLQYIDNWSLKLDIILMIRTVGAVFGRTGY